MRQNVSQQYLRILSTRCPCANRMTTKNTKQRNKKGLLHCLPHCHVLRKYFQHINL